MMFRKLLAALLLLPALVFAQQSGNLSGVLLPSAARTAASVATIDQTNCCWKGGHVTINVTAYTSGNYTPVIQAKDPVSGTYYPVLSGTAISSTGITVLKVYPGIGAVQYGSTSDVLPKVWRVLLTGASSPSMTFSVGMFLEQ